MNEKTLRDIERALELALSIAREAAGYWGVALDILNIIRSNPDDIGAMMPEIHEKIQALEPLEKKL